MEDLIKEMDSLFKQVVKYYPMSDLKETKMQWNGLVSAVEKQFKQQSNCNLPHVSGSLPVEENNKYHFAREILFELRVNHSIDHKAYLHWLDKLINDEKASLGNDH